MNQPAARTAISEACDAAMHRLRKSINATAGQHLRAIRKGFADAGAPVVAEVSAAEQQRIPVVSEGTASAQRINTCPYLGYEEKRTYVDCRLVERKRGPVKCLAGGCNYPEGDCEGGCA